MEKHIIENTELVYTETDAIILRVFLGDSQENFIDYAKRLWKDYDHNPIDSESQKCNAVSSGAFQLWENKKASCRSLFGKLFKIDTINDALVLEIQESEEYTTRDAEFLKKSKELEESILLDKIRKEEEEEAMYIRFLIKMKEDGLINQKPYNIKKS